MKKIIIATTFLLFAVTLFAAKLPTYESIIGPPIDKKNGGYVGDYCSMHCKLKWLTDSTSAIKGHYSRQLDDNLYKTCWTEGAKGYGKGKIIMMYFPHATIDYKEIENDYKIRWNGFTLLNGDCKSKSAWNNSSRVKKMKIYKNGEAVCYITLIDTDRWQTVEFGMDMWIEPGDQIESEIISVYNAKAAKTSLTEFVIMGGHDELFVGH